jgi:cytoskeletal protein CcmA (bactofilin family)
MAIMRKDEPSPDKPINVGQTHTILGPESSFEGKLVFQGTVRIDGKFSGEVVTNDVLVVGEGALVKAELDVGSLVLNGEIHGNVRAKSAVEIHAPGKLRGNLETPKLVIDAGVTFDGHCKMDGVGSGGPPKAASTPPPVALEPKK